MSERVRKAEVGIVGAGPGGMAAASALAGRGRSVIVLDEGQRAGGQIFRQLPPGVRSPAGVSEPPSHDHGHELIHSFEGASAGAKVELVSGATVWDAKPGRLWFEHAGESHLLECERILLSPGAMDRCIPFPGWTLPGVTTAGALQEIGRAHV